MGYFQSLTDGVCYTEQGDKAMRKTSSIWWAAMMAGVAMLLVFASACGETKTIEVPGETIIVEKEVVKTVEVPGETVTVTEVQVKEVEVPGETKIVEKIRTVVEQVEVPGETVVVEKEVVIAGPERIVIKEVSGGTKTVTQTDRYANNIWGELVEMPQYGGSIAMPLEKDDGSFDPWHSDSLKHHSLVLEKPFHIDWSLSPGVHDWAMAGYPTASTISEGLAESWEMPDGLTTIFNLSLIHI